jgi:hypothetical protein
MNGFKRLERTCNKCGTSIWWNNDDMTMKDTGSWYEGYPLGRIHDKIQCNKRIQEMPYMAQAGIEDSYRQEKLAKKEGREYY